MPQVWLHKKFDNFFFFPFCGDHLGISYLCNNYTILKYMRSLPLLVLTWKFRAFLGVRDLRYSFLYIAIILCLLFWQSFLLVGTTWVHFVDNEFAFILSRKFYIYSIVWCSRSVTTLFSSWEQFRMTVVTFTSA